MLIKSLSVATLWRFPYLLSRSPAVRSVGELNCLQAVIRGQCSTVQMPTLRSVAAKAVRKQPGLEQVKTEVHHRSERNVEANTQADHPLPVSTKGRNAGRKRDRPLTSANKAVPVTDDLSVPEPAKQRAKVGKAKLRKSLLTTLWTEADLIPLKAKAEQLYDQLNELYKDPPCPLNFQTPFQLLVAVILSAQTTDKKVNEITPPLFEMAPDAHAMSEMEVAEVQELIRQVGLAPTKAKNICNMSKMLVAEHNGVVPQTFQELEKLPGVGHKTASVLICTAFGTPTFPVDTHIHRLAQRWGFTKGKSVEQTEADLKVLLPEAKWNNYHLRLIYFGREHCPAQRHDPAMCPICSWAAVPPYNRTGASPQKA